MLRSTELNTSSLEKSRRAYARVLQAFAENGKATAIAAHLGVNDSTISRIKNEKLEDVIHILYLLGFKVVECDDVLVAHDEWRGLQAQARRLLAWESRHGRLSDEDGAC